MCFCSEISFMQINPNFSLYRVPLLHFVPLKGFLNSADYSHVLCMYLCMF